MLATLTVGNLNDSGTGSLRDAISIANGNGETDTINFSVTGTINIDSQLPTITEDLTIDGENQITIDAGNGTDGEFDTADGFRHIEIDGTTTRIEVSINGLALVGGDVLGNGGAIFNREILTICNSTLMQNAASANGGGIYIDNAGSVTVVSSALESNSAGYSGGGINNRNVTIVTHSALLGNSALFGGGILNDDTATIINSTISENIATSNSGGGVYNSSDSNTTISHSTLAGNMAGIGSGIYDSYGGFGDVTLTNSIVAYGGVGTDIGGERLSGGHNLIEDGTGGLGDTIVGDPLLGLLANNGGPTPTHALLPGSIAINRGDPSFTINGPDGQPGTDDDLPFDQRGESRSQNGRLDIGAFESSFDAPILPNELIVTTTESKIDGDYSANDLSLAEAIAIAHLGISTSEITFSPLFATPQTIALDDELSISQPLTLVGPGSALLTIDAGHGEDGLFNTGDGHRLFRIGDGNFLSVFEVELSGMTLTGGDAIGHGGAISSEEKVLLLNSVASGNAATRMGGAVSSFGNSSSVITISDSTVAGNSAGANGGGVFISQGTLNIDGSTLSDNSAVENGGGVFIGGGSCFISASTVSGNTAGENGGGAYNESRLTITSSTISGNSAAGDGGGIHNWFSATVNVLSSTLVGNMAGDDGGGIFNDDRAIITNSTLSGNIAADDGGGIYNDNRLTVANSTLTGNSAAAGGGLFNRRYAWFNNSIIANSISGLDVASSIAGFNGANNFVSDGTDGLPDTIKGAPLLGSLADNGGPTMTHTLLPGSFAINQGDPAFDVNGPDGEPGTDDDLPFDQRGMPRIKNGRIDIGAYESDLDAPEMPLDLVVTTTEGGIDGDFSPTDLSLAEAVVVANFRPGAEEITFSSLFSTPQTILLSQQLLVSDVLTVLGPGAELLTLDAGNGADGVFGTGDGAPIFVINDFDTAEQSPVELRDLRLTGGDVAGDGGAIANSEELSIVTSEIDFNAATRGGGIYNQTLGKLTLDVVSFSNNNSTEAGGGLYNSGDAIISDSLFAGNSAGTDGGALLNFDELTLMRSSLRENSAQAAGGGLSHLGGQASISLSNFANNTAGTNGGAIRNSRDMTIASSTISGNTATAGGGIHTDDPLNIRHSTLTANGAETGGAIAMYHRIILNDTIISGNVSGGDIYLPYDQSILGAHNLVEDGSDNLLDTITGSALLGPLADNGGPTRTHALLPGSLAINRGDPGFSVDGPDGQPGTEDDVPFDQRGFARVQNGRIDIGAYESNLDAPALPTELIVTTTEGVVDGDYSAGDLSLPEAIVFANLNEGPDAIIFSPLFETAQTIPLTAQLVVYNEVSITGPGSDLLTLDAGDGVDGQFNTGDGFRLFKIDDRNNTYMENSISGMTLTGGDTARNGGAILHRENLTLSDVNISANAAGNVGGGIYAYGTSLITLGGTTNITNSEIVANVASTAGGAIYSSAAVVLADSILSQNEAEDGGGVYLARVIDSTITRSLIYQNHARNDGGGVVAFDGDASITNTTISGNTAGRFGGGVFVGRFFNLLALEHSTITGNAADVQGGGTFAQSSLPASRFVITNSIVANTTAGGDVSGPVTGSYNFVGDGSGGLPETIAGNPRLGPLAENGGATWTHALLPGSPVIDAGDPEPASTSPFDQRGAGYARVANGGTSLRSDLGAYEAQVTPSADFDSDGDIDGGDFLAWQRGYGNAQAIRADGNSDDDTDVDASDLAAWQTHYRSVNNPIADFDLDDDADGGDFLIWQRGFATTYDESDLTSWQLSYGNTNILLPFAAVQINEGPLALSSETSIDVTIDMPILESEPAESPRFIEELTIVDEAFASTIATKNLPLVPQLAHEPLLAELEDIVIEDHNPPWLEKELLERVFG